RTSTSQTPTPPAWSARTIRRARRTSRSAVGSFRERSGAAPSISGGVAPRGLQAAIVVSFRAVYEALPRRRRGAGPAPAGRAGVAWPCGGASLGGRGHRVVAAPTHGRFGPAVRHFRPVGPLILAQGVFFGSRPEGRRTGSTRSEYDFFNSGFPTGRPGGEGLKRQPAHPLLALQLRRA